MAKEDIAVVTRREGTAAAKDDIAVTREGTVAVKEDIAVVTRRAGTAVVKGDMAAAKEDGEGNI